MRNLFSHYKEIPKDVEGIESFNNIIIDTTQ